MSTMSRQVLQSFVRDCAVLSEKVAKLKLHGSSACDDELSKLIECARRLVSSMNADAICAHLPDSIALHAMYAPVYYADIYQSNSMHICLFGFKQRGYVMPLHNHPEIYGFLKVIRGAVEVNSFTELSAIEQQEAVDCESKQLLSSGVQALRVEGRQIRNANDDCLVLSPSYGNIHSVKSLEDGATFFDLLIPGYGCNPCTYYKMCDEQPEQSRICLVEKTPEPSHYYCQGLPYDPVVI